MIGTRIFVGLTDQAWYRHLFTLQPEEANFWRPSSRQKFAALAPGEPFLFKLHRPHAAIVGGGFFDHYTRLPLSMAWLAFGEKNGAGSLGVCRERLGRYWRGDPGPDPEIGCIVLDRPFFFDERDWIAEPPDWRPQTQVGKTLDTAEAAGRMLWQEVEQRLRAMPLPEVARAAGAQPLGYWAPGFRRLGQGAFRAAVTDAYDRRCAVTGEHTLPVLEAAHIQGFAAGGPHDTRNGLLLRADLHILLDAGYVGVDEDYRFLVSPRLEAEYHNGRDYYRRQGQRILLPAEPEAWPAQEFLAWHRSHVFVA